MNQSGDVQNAAHTRPATAQQKDSNNNLYFHDNSHLSSNLSAVSFMSSSHISNQVNLRTISSSKGNRPTQSDFGGPKRRHGRLRKMGIISIEDRMEQQQMYSQQKQKQRDEFSSSTANVNDSMVSKSLPALHTSDLLPPIRPGSSSSVMRRSFSPKSNQHQRSNASSSSRPSTAMGFGSNTDRNLTNDAAAIAANKQNAHTLEELHHIEQMMNSNRPKSSSVKVQIKRYMSDIETLERNSQLSFAHASTNALKANFTYTGSLDELQDVFSKEAKSFDSVALFAQARYLEMINFEGADREPTKFKAALCSDLMGKLISSIGRYGGVMNPLLWEMLNCIFIDFEKVEERFKHDPNALMLKELVRAPTYLELAHQLHDRLEEMQVEAEIANRGMQMKSLVKKFQTLRFAFQQTDIFIRDACFMLWRGYFRKHQRMYKIARLRGLRYRFKQWRYFVSQEHGHVRKGEDLADQLDAKIHRLMTLNQNLLQMSEQNADQQANNGANNGNNLANRKGAQPSLAKQATKRNVSDDMSPQIISNILYQGGAGSDSEPATPSQITPRHVNLDPNSVNILTIDTNSANEQNNARPLSSSDKRVHFFKPGGKPLEAESSALLTPDASRPSTAGGVMYHHDGEGSSDNDQTNSSSYDGSRPDTPDLMEFNRKQSLAAAQLHNIPEHVLNTRPPPNAARAIMRHRAAVVGTNNVRAGHSSHHRRRKIPQQDVGVQANAEEFDAVDIHNHRIMLSRATISNKGSRNKLDTNPDGDDFDQNQYMVIVLSPRDQHETHVGNITTCPLQSITAKMKAIQDHGSSPHARPNPSTSANTVANALLEKPETLSSTTATTVTSAVSTSTTMKRQRHQSVSVSAESASIYLSTTLSMDMVVHLISAIYEHLFCHYFYDPRATDEVSSVLFLARDVIYRRYHHDRNLGKTIFKEFVRGCLEYVGLSKRIEVFCKLSGLITPDLDDVETGGTLAALTDEAASISKIKLTADNIKAMNLRDKLHFFILMLSLWSNNIPLLAVNLLLSSMIDREIVLQHLPELFPSLEKENRVYDQLMATVIDLPCYHADSLRKSHFAEADKIDLDVLCDIFLRYELPERQARQELSAYISSSNVEDSNDDYDEDS